jgi:tetratricopeptide (TPR) repeat protein
MVLGVFVLCLPLLFVGWLLAAAHWSSMDASTLNAPESLRQMVASVILERTGNSLNQLASLQRVIRLNPDEGSAWTWLCSGYIPGNHPPSDLATCRRALALQPTSNNYNALGRLQELSGDECAAEDTFTKAAGKDASTGLYESAENMGRAALRCGDLYGSRAALEVAIGMQDKSLKDSDLDEDEIAEIRKDRLSDNEYLVIVLDRLKLPTLARQACTEAHPDWSGCACLLDARGKAACQKAPSRP